MPQPDLTEMKIAKGTKPEGPYYPAQDIHGWGVALRGRIILRSDNETKATECAETFNTYVEEYKIK